MLALDVRTSTKAVGIDRAAKRVRLRNHSSGTTEELAYDKLLLAPDAVPVGPALPGIDDARIFTLRSAFDCLPAERLGWCAQLPPGSNHRADDRFSRETNLR